MFLRNEWIHVTMRWKRLASGKLKLYANIATKQYWSCCLDFRNSGRSVHNFGLVIDTGDTILLISDLGGFKVIHYSILVSNTKKIVNTQDTFYGVQCPPKFNFWKLNVELRKLRCWILSTTKLNRETNNVKSTIGVEKLETWMFNCRCRYKL